MSLHRMTFAALLACCLSAPALAREPAGFVFHPERQVERQRPTLAKPLKLNFVGEKTRSVTPVFTRDALFATAPQKLYGLGRYAGDVTREPVYDPSSDKWFAWAGGMIVEVHPDGRLIVVVEDPPGHDFDIRAAKGLAVYRDPNRNEIVLQRLEKNARGEHERTVLHSGIQFFNPRFSPQGDKVVVGDDGGPKGRLFVTDLESKRTLDAGVGSQPTWSPDGDTLYFMDFENDSYNFTASKLYARDLEHGVTELLFESRSVIATHPAISRDGRKIAFFDEASMDVAVAELPAQEVR